MICGGLVNESVLNPPFRVTKNLCADCCFHVYQNPTTAEIRSHTLVGIHKLIRYLYRTYYILSTNLLSEANFSTKLNVVHQCYATGGVMWRFIISISAYQMKRATIMALNVLNNSDSVYAQYDANTVDLNPDLNFYREGNTGCTTKYYAESEITEIVKQHTDHNIGFSLRHLNIISSPKNID